jgi:hypothetical protein
MRLEAATVELNPGQKEVMASGLLTSGFNCVLQMPTGAGKTWLAEQAIAAEAWQWRISSKLVPCRTTSRAWVPVGFISTGVAPAS